VKAGDKAAQGAEANTAPTQLAAERAPILAMDYGRARIGLAIADAGARLARPLATLQRVNRNEDMRRLRELVREHGVKQIVVGLPLRLDGTPGEMAEEVGRFAARAAKQIGVRVELVDERLTSWEAERLMEEEFGRAARSLEKPGGRTHPRPTTGGQAQKPKVGRSRRKKETESGVSVDAVAAAVILKEYLERQEIGEQQAKSARAE
jgi:putative Holliday junction resolvase